MVRFDDGEDDPKCVAHLFHGLRGRDRLTVIVGRKNMPRWRKEAFDRLPECRKQLQAEKDPYGFFGVLGDVLWRAHLAKDEDLIGRIYGFAKWCLDAPRGKDATDDLLTIITVTFFEGLPRHKEVRQEIGRWFPRKFIAGMHDVFCYLGSEEKYREMLASCDVTEFRRNRANQSPEPTAGKRPPSNQSSPPAAAHR